MPVKLILASMSARRQSLLAQFGLPFEVDVADIDETPLADESPADMTLRLARQKAQVVYARRNDKVRVLAGDTTVALGMHNFGKPADKHEAISMLTQLSGNTHSVHSAIAIVDAQGIDALLSTTLVEFAPLTATQIARYCDTDEPYDKAGGYGIQGPAGAFVTRIEGSYSGVIGLPLWHTHQLLFNRHA